MTKRETVPEALEKWAKIKPDQLVWQFHNSKTEIEESYTFKELESATTALSSYLLDDCGLKQGDIVLLVCVPGLTFTASLVACFKAGLVGVPVYPPDPTRASKELVHFTTIQQDCGAKVALTDSTYSSARTLGAVKSFFTFGKKEYVWPDLKWITVDTILKAGKSANLPPRHNPPAELAFLQYTSGSTSAPKGVMVTAQNLAANYFHYSQVRDMRNKKIVTWLPQYHDMGLIGCYLQWVHTGSTGYFFSPISFIRDPLCWIRLIGRYQPEVTAAPNFAYALVVRKLKEAKPEVLKEIRSLDLSSLRIIYSGAEPINIAVVQEFLATFAPMGMPASAYSPCYGLAEHTLLAGGGYGKGLLLVDKTALENGKVEIKLALEDFRQPFEHIEGTVPFVACGRTDYEGNAMISVDPVSCEVCPEDRVGELWLNSDSKAQGYYNRPEATQDTFRARLLGGGTAEQRRMEWLRSGDLVIIHKNEFFFCGRHKDLIVLNGRNYYPQDVERTAEGCHRALRPGCSAAFAVQQGHGADQTEGVILIAELQAGVPASSYEKIVESVTLSVSQEQGLYLSGVVLLQCKSILKTTSGKISRAACRKAFLDGKLQVAHQYIDLDDTSSPAPRSNAKATASTPAAAAKPTYTIEQVRAKIAEMVKQVTGMDEVAADAMLMDVGLTSGAASELSGHLSKEFGVKIRPTVMFINPTINDVALRVMELMEAHKASAAPTELASDVAPKEESLFERLRPEAFIAGWGVAVPFPLATETFLKIDRRERERLGQSEEVIQQMGQFVTASRIHNRYSCHPFFLPDGKKPSDYPDAVGTMKEDIFSEHENFTPTLERRMQCYQDTCVALCVTAAERAVQHWGKDRKSITHILTTCTSGWTEPGIGCAVIKGVGLSEDIQKAELNFNGCFCGATCLRMARDLIRAGDANAVLIVACEVSTTHFDWNLVETERMVAQSLFADGAASIVVAKEGIWRYSQTGGAIVPNSSHLLGLRPPMQENEHTFIMTLSKLVAPSLYAYFSKGHGKEIIRKLYNPREPKPALAIHPGGPRILEAVGDVLFELGWKEDALQSSFDTFGKYGNLGSAAMLFVLAYRLGQDNIVEDKLITMAFGPGVTVEYAQLERATPANSNAVRQAAAMASIAPASANQQGSGSNAAGKNGGQQAAAPGGMQNNTLMMFMLLQTFAVLLFGAYFLQRSGM